MEFYYNPETIYLQGFNPSASSSCMAKVNEFSHPSDSYSNPIFHIPHHTTVLLPIDDHSCDFHFQLPCETDHQDTETLLQGDWFQDIIYGAAVANHQEPPRTTTAMDSVEEPILRGISELCEKLSKSIRKGLRNNLERLNNINICVPTTRKRGLNVGNCTSKRGLDQFHRSGDQDRMKLDRFKVRTLIVGVDGEVKDEKK